MVLENAPQKLTRLEILGEWPPDLDKPSASNLAKWLARSVLRGLVTLEGNGRRANPFRYWLPEREAVWKQGPLYDVLEELKSKYPFQSLTKKQRTDSEGGDR